MNDNISMNITGRVENGVVVLEGEINLPEGLVVTVLYPKEPKIHIATSQKKANFPLVPSAFPGSVHLTNAQITEILDEEDAAS